MTIDLTDQEKPERREYPKLSSVISEGAGKPLTVEMIDRNLAYLRSPKYQEDRARQEEFAYQQRKALAADTERRYAKYLGVESLNDEQRKELWDGCAEALAKRIGLYEWFNED